MPDTSYKAGVMTPIAESICQAHGESVKDAYRVRDKPKRDIQYIVISDVHLGHPDTTAAHILANLDREFDNYSSSSRYTELDAIFIAGDLFDSPLPLNSPVREQVINWGSKILPFCAKHNISLIALEGTPSHDAKQTRVLQDMANAYKEVFPALDFMYVDELSIQWHPKLERMIAYVPDECRDTCRETEEWMENEMLRMGIDQFDIAIMHGVFGYQLAYGSPDHKYREDWWLSRCRGYIHIGHHHNHTHYLRIIAQGSYDRLCHGQEGPKGFVWVREVGDERRFSFIENRNAKIYKTIELGSVDLARSLARLEREIQALADGSHIRVIADRQHPIHQGQKDLVKAYPSYRLKFEYEKQNDEKTLALKSDIAMVAYVPVTLTPENIVERQMAFVDETMPDLCTHDRGLLESYLQSML